MSAVQPVSPEQALMNLAGTAADLKTENDALLLKLGNAVALLLEAHSHLYPDITAHQLTERIKVFLEAK